MDIYDIVGTFSPVTTKYKSRSAETCNEELKSKLGPGEYFLNSRNQDFCFNSTPGYIGSNNGIPVDLIDYDSSFRGLNNCEFNINAKQYIPEMCTDNRWNSDRQKKSCNTNSKNFGLERLDYLPAYCEAENVGHEYISGQNTRQYAKDQYKPLKANMNFGLRKNYC